eukprot:6285377-Heterocapsa_arctica.AAC.1
MKKRRGAAPAKKRARSAPLIGDDESGEDVLDIGENGASAKRWRVDAEAMVDPRGPPLAPPAAAPPGD